MAYCSELGSQFSADTIYSSCLEKLLTSELVNLSSSSDITAAVSESGKPQSRQALLSQLAKQVLF